MIQLEGIRPEHVGLYWPHVEGWIGETVADAGHCWTVSDVRADLDARRMQLWVIWAHSEMVGCVATHVYDSPRGKTCAVPIVYCDDMAACIRPVLHTIELFALSLGCVRLQGEGRAGWERALRPLGWKKITTQVEKAIGHGL